MKKKKKKLKIQSSQVGFAGNSNMFTFQYTTKLRCFACIWRTGAGNHRFQSPYQNRYIINIRLRLANIIRCSQLSVTAFVWLTRKNYENVIDATHKTSYIITIKIIKTQSVLYKLKSIKQKKKILIIIKYFGKI